MPPALISCTGLAKAYARPLFSDLSLAIQSGERVGLIGPNGSGKSTLLRILAGEEQPDAGEIATSKGVRVAYLPQDDRFEPGLTAEDVVVAALADHEHLTDEGRRTQARIVLGKVGFRDLAQLAETLSGGWRKRLALARVLAQEPDLVLLDEPTNHLDLSGIAWLEKLLESAPFAWLVVTHDRYLLERVAARVIEIGRHYEGGSLSVDGSYTTFLVKREEHLAGQRSREQSLANEVRREVEWLRRGPRGRGTKAKGRISKAHAAMEELGEVRARNAAADRTAEIDFAATGRKTRDLLRAEALRVERGGRLLVDGLDLRLGPGDRLGLVGDNGCGKSTLLAVLAGERPVDGGRLEWAKDLKIVTFHQDRARLDPEATLRHTLCAEGDTVHYRGGAMHVTAWAKRFQFDTEQLNTRVGALSGGEQARLLVADLVRQPADLLVLDEPTNDLDLGTREVLEESLTEFPGALLLVTHDRYMLERVCTGLLGFDGFGAARPLADLDQWSRMVAAARRAAKEAKGKAKGKAAPSRTPSRRRPGLTSKEKREWEAMEETIMAAEGEVERLEARVAAPDVLADHEALQQGYADLHAAQQRVEALYARWEALEAKRQA